MESKFVVEKSMLFAVGSIVMGDQRKLSIIDRSNHYRYSGNYQNIDIIEISIVIKVSIF